MRRAVVGASLLFSGCLWWETGGSSGTGGMGGDQGASSGLVSSSSSASSTGAGDDGGPDVACYLCSEGNTWAKIDSYCPESAALFAKVLECACMGACAEHHCATPDAARACDVIHEFSPKSDDCLLCLTMGCAAEVAACGADKH